MILYEFQISNLSYISIRHLHFLINNQTFSFIHAFAYDTSQVSTTF